MGGLRWDVGDVKLEPQAWPWSLRLCSLRAMLRAGPRDLPVRRVDMGSSPVPPGPVLCNLEVGCGCLRAGGAQTTFSARLCALPALCTLDLGGCLAPDFFKRMAIDGVIARGII